MVTGCKLNNILEKFENIFAIDKVEVGLIRNAEHQIILKNSDEITRLPNRRIPLAFEEKVSDSIKELLEAGIIRHSDSPFNSPIVVVPKKNGSIRLCVDYRKLNENTVRSSFYFPDIGEIFDKLGGNKFFSTLDMQKGYYQVKMSDKSIEKTAFSCHEGHFEFNRMPFGLCGAPCTFQKIVQDILANDNYKTCLAYLDNIIIFGRTLEEHNERLFHVLSKLREAGVKLSKEKCIFAQRKVRFLGHVITEDGIHTDPEKTNKVKNWKKNLKQ